MKTLTSNVLEGLSSRLQGNTAQGEKILVVFNGSDINLNNRLEELKRLRNGGDNLSVAFSFMAERILDVEKIKNGLRPERIYKEEDIFKIKRISMEYNMIIGPNITINTLSKVALGMIDGFVPSLIWTFLYEGKSVHLDFSAVRNYLGKESVNKEILKITNGYIESIKNMGAIEMDNNIILTMDKSLKDMDTFEESKSQSKTLVTEKDIVKLSQNSTFKLAKGTIITPLAKDKAKEKNIKIEIR